jgi:hypothetical protein
MTNEKYQLINKLTDNILSSSNRIEDLFEQAKKECSKNPSTVFLIKESATGNVLQEYQILMD